MIQIDMPMPKTCFECPACNEYLCCAIPIDGRMWGENDVSDFNKGRPRWCPMKELETEWCERCGRVRLKSNWEGRCENEID